MIYSDGAWVRDWNVLLQIMRGLEFLQMAGFDLFDIFLLIAHLNKNNNQLQTVIISQLQTMITDKLQTNSKRWLYNSRKLLL